MQFRAIRGSLGRMHARPVATLVALALASACSAGAPADAPARPRAPLPGPASGPSVPPVQAQAGPPPAAPGFRLGDAVVPLAYELELELDPRLTRYQGRVAIDVRIDEPVRSIWLHAADLAVDGAHLEQLAGDGRTGSDAPELVRADVQVEPNPGAGAAAERSGAPDPVPSSEVIRLDLEQPVAPGRARLVLTFVGHYGRRVGIFRQEVGGNAYVFSDFEPVDARRAFPCLDEPRWKTPWRISLTVPAGMHGLSNMPVERAEPLPRGQTRVHFAPTRPLPTYLVAVAAGPFELVDAPGALVPLRVVVPRGRAAWAQDALAVAPRLLAIVQDYFGTPVPFPKLDLISVPEMNGAMENPGLITVASHILLSDPDRPAIPQRRFLALVIAHEFAHLWFGDLVTPAEWRELWLNEGLATWLADKALLALWPERRPELDQVASREEAMREDQADSRAVRPPAAQITSREALGTIFDTITYKKGGAIVAMLEDWIGEDALRQALRAYVAAHADGNADTEALIQALVAATEREVRAPLRAFLEQPGVPLVHAELSCTPRPGRAARAMDVAVILSQRRYLPLGEAEGGAPAATATWHVPVCMRYDAGAGASAESCVLLDAPEQRVALDVAHCPAWLVPNAGAHGYYRYTMPAATLAPLGRAPLASREAVDLAHGVRALLRSGDLAADQALAVAHALGTRSERHVVEAIIDLLVEIERHVLPPERQERFRARVRSLFGARARLLGLAPAPGESEENTLLRPRLIAFAGRWGREPELLRATRQLAETWLRTGQGIAPGMIEVVLAVAAAGGDEALFRNMERALRAADPAKESDAETRQQVLAAALSAFDDPALVARVLTMLDDSALPLTVRNRLLFGLLERRDALPAALAHLEARKQTLVGSRAGRLLLFTLLITAPLCSDGDVERARALGALLVEYGVVPRAFLAEHERSMATTARTCDRMRAVHAEGVSTFYR
jgi:alanyl aminopeptidase